jgi:hypothetical protein
MPSCNELCFAMTESARFVTSILANRRSTSLMASTSARDRDAILTLSAPVGAIAMARAVDDSDLSHQILVDTAGAALLARLERGLPRSRLTARAPQQRTLWGEPGDGIVGIHAWTFSPEVGGVLLETEESGAAAPSRFHPPRCRPRSTSH